jgi:hypothetical protein
VPDAVVYVAMLLACSLAAVGGARLLGSRMWLGGVITSYRRDDWPYDVQEPDAPAELDGMPPAAEIVEVHVRGYTRPDDAAAARPD